MSTSVQPVAADAILFHAGFHKTGTTALQSAFASSRPALIEAGVCYPGDLRSHHRAAMAVTGRTWGWEARGGRPPRGIYWDELVTEATSHPGRVVIDSEAFSLATDEALDLIVSALGADRLHAVLTLRPFATLLPSSYQQYLKYGLAMPYPQWLENVFAAPPECPPSPNFWRRNDHAGVIERWAARLGPDKVTLIVLDDADRAGLYRTFEALLELPEGLLVPDPEISASNRSMTAAESEMLRLINAAGARHWDWPAYQNGVRRGAVMRMVESRTPAPDEPRLATPSWAVAAGQEVGRATAQRVAELGVTVLGDPARLSAPIPHGESEEPVLLPAQAAAEAVLGAIEGAVRGALAEAPTQADVDRAARRAEARGERRGAKRAIAALGTRDAAALLRLRLGQAGRRRMGMSRRPEHRSATAAADEPEAPQPDGSQG